MITDLFGGQRRRAVA